MGNFNTSDSLFSDLNGSMTTTGNNINTYTSNNLGAATSVSNRPAPPPVSCVLTFSNGTQYTICGRTSGTGFVGKAQQGNQSCPTSGLPGNGDDDWTASRIGEDEVISRPKSKSGKKKKPAGKKAAKKPAGKKAASKKAAKKSAGKKTAGKKAAKKPASKKAASKKAAKKTASKKR